MAPLAKKPRTVATPHGRAGKDERGLPVVLVTGFLGAGKTTVVNHVLRTRQHIRAAVFVNEYGAADVDGEVLRAQGKIERSRVFTLQDGCMCCGGGDDLRDVLAEELDARAMSQLDVLIIETSGVCDPGPVLAALAEARGVYVDSVVVVFDATTVHTTSFGACTDARRQLAYADVLMLSKIDLLEDKAMAEALEAQLLAQYREVAGVERPAPRLIRKALPQVSLEDLCAVPVDRNSKAHGQKCLPAIGGTKGTHEEFPTHSFVVGRAFDAKRFEAWAATVKGLLRAKGLIWVRGESQSMVWHFAGGRSSGLHVVEGSQKPQGSELVFIGRYGEDWSPVEMDRGLTECLA